MQLFSADATMFSKKTLKNMKNDPQRSLIIGQFFFQYWPSCHNGLKTEISYHQKPLNAGLDIQTGAVKECT